MRAGTGICSSIPDPEGYRIKLAVILASHMIKNAEKFCGHGKFGVVVDTYGAPSTWKNILSLQI